MTSDWALTILLAALGIGMAALLLFVLGACVQSGNDAEHERRLDALRALGWQEWPLISDERERNDD